MARRDVLPSAKCTASAPRIGNFRGSMAGLCAPLSTLRRCPRGHLRMTRGRCGSLLLHRDVLAPSTPCRSPGALRFTPKLGHCTMQPAWLKRAKFGLMHRSKLSDYSITSSARPSSVGGILNPIARAVLRSTLSRNLVGNSTGRSEGFRPLRILSTNVADWHASASMSAEYDASPLGRKTSNSERRTEGDV